MSVVRHASQRQFEVDEYDRVYATRLLVKPGITGPWQVSGRNDLSEEESRQLDVSYVQNWCRCWGTLCTFSVLSARSCTPMAHTEF